MINELMEYLAKAEGSHIHRNKTESDITAFYGIYRTANESFYGWEWLDNLAEKYRLIGYRQSLARRKKLNEIIESIPEHKCAYDEIAKDFHGKEAKRIGLDKFPDTKTALTYFSLYTNSKQGSGLSLQRALNELTNASLVVDGMAGKNTLNALQGIKDAGKLNMLMLDNMQDYYDSLIKQNPSKFAMYAKGWRNRLLELA